MEGDSRTRILHVALELVDRFGYVGTSMEAIRTAAGYRTQSSLYRHFLNKDSLTAALLERVRAEKTAALAPYVKPEIDAMLDDVLDAAEHLTRWGLMNPAAYRLCFLQRSWGEGMPVLGTGDSGGEAVSRWAARVIRRIQREGGPVRRMDPDFLIASCLGLITQTIVGAQDPAPDRIDRLAFQTRELCCAIVFADPVAMPIGAST